MYRVSRFLAGIGVRWSVPGLLLLISLAVPATRELHLLLLRMYLRVPGGETYVHGQPPGCTMYIVPSVEFTRDAGSRLLDRSNQSPDAFLLAHAVNSSRVSLPPADLVAAHPILPWIALRASCLAHDRARLSRWQSTTQPRPDRDLPSDTLLEEALAIVRSAQSSEPQNGMLWVAEALLRFDLGQDTAADRAIAAASSAAAWDDESRNAYPCLRNLFMKHGFPEFDASILAYSNAGPLSSRAASHSLRRELLEHMASAVEEQDSRRLSLSLARLTTFLEGASPEGGLAGNPFIVHQDMIAEMAAQMGRTLPTYADPRGVRILAEEEVPYLYLAQHVDSNRAWRLRALVALGDSIWRDQTQPLRHLHDRWFRQAVFSGAASSLAILIFGTCLAAVLAEVPFVPARVAARRDRPIPSGRFLCAGAVVVLAAMTGVMFNAMDLVCQPVGLRSVEHRPVLTPLQENLAVAGILCLCLLLVRYLFHTRPKYYRIGLAVLLCIWLIVAGSAAWLRQSVVADLDRLCGV